MMKRNGRISLILFCCLMIGVNFPLHAKKEGLDAIDSMLKDLSSSKYSKKADTDKVKLLVSLSWAYSGINPDEQLRFGNQALELSQKTNWSQGLAWSFGAIGDYYSDISEYSKATIYYRKDSLMACIGALRSEQAAATSNLANIFLIHGDYKIALEYLFTSIRINEELGSMQNLANDCSSVGVIFSNRGLYPKALEYFYRALKVYDSLGNKIAISNAYANIGKALERQGYIFQANEYYHKSLLIDSLLVNNSGIANAYDNLGRANQALGKFDIALDYYKKALKVGKSLKNPLMIASCLSSIGYVYQLQKNYNDALSSYTMSLRIFNDIKDKSSYAVTLNNIANCYLEVYKIKIGNFHTSLKSEKIIEVNNDILKMFDFGGNNNIPHIAECLFLKSLDANRQLREFTTMQFSYDGLSTICKLSGNYKKALEYADSSRSMHDSVFSSESKDQILKIQLKNEYEQQHLSDSLKQKQIVQEGNYKIQKQRFFQYISTFFSF